MSDVDFAALRQRLEEGVRPPAFTEIRARRRRRSQWLAAMLAGTVTLVALAATAVATLPRREAQPIGPGVMSPGPTATAAPSAAAGPARYEILGLSAGDHGDLYLSARRCVAACDTDPGAYKPVLMHSADLGRTWSPALALPVAGPVLLVNGAHPALGVLGDGTLWLSSDGGRGWPDRVTVPKAEPTQLLATVAGTTIWLARAPNVLLSVGTEAGHRLVRHLVQVPGLADVRHLSAVDDQHATAIGMDAAGKTAWYGTNDGGAHWNRVADPCANTPLGNATDSTLAVGPDGTQWVVCASEPGAGQMRKELVVVRGGTVISQGTLESSGYATQVYPFGPSVAWRTGGRADIYRTANRTVWTDVAAAVPDGPTAFAALDANTAVYIDMPDDRPTLHVTRDGGRTWTAHPI